ncbi:MAG: recombinase family protein [Propionibacteriales bacterium]|nr:recombinase family protein [Propionibacteriales bacterium]
MRAVGYARVSTAEQADSGAGMDAQRHAIRGEAERRGWSLEDVVEDAGYSAKDLRRPGIGVVLERMASGEADVLVVSKLDRLSRSLIDFAQTMATAQREGWALVALDLGVDTATPGGEMMANVLASFAQYERRIIGQRTRDGLAAKKAAGVKLGRRSTLPLEVVERILAAHQAGDTLAAIARGLEVDSVATGQGGARWYPASVRAVLVSQGHAVRAGSGPKRSRSPAAAYT